MYRPRKYRNKPGIFDGLQFDSQREIQRYAELKLLEKAGEIKSLVADKTLLRYALVVNGMHICDFEADFSYRLPDDRLVIEDTKAVRTREYVIKKKLLFALYGYQIVET